MLAFAAARCFSVVMFANCCSLAFGIAVEMGRGRTALRGAQTVTCVLPRSDAFVAARGNHRSKAHDRPAASPLRESRRSGESCDARIRCSRICNQCECFAQLGGKDKTSRPARRRAHSHVARDRGCEAKPHCASDRDGYCVHVIFRVVHGAMRGSCLASNRRIMVAKKAAIRRM